MRFSPILQLLICSLLLTSCSFVEKSLPLPQRDTFQNNDTVDDRTGDSGKNPSKHAVAFVQKKNKETVIHALEEVTFLGSEATTDNYFEYLSDMNSIVDPIPIGYEQNGRKSEQPQSQLGVKGKLMVSVEEMELNQFLHLIFGRYLTVNYVVDPAVEKQKDLVTIHMQESVSRKVFEKFIRNVLQKYNVVVKERGSVFFVEPTSKKTTHNEDYMAFVGRLIPEDVEASQELLMFIPFHYTDVNKYVKIIKTLKPMDKGSVFAMGKNTLIVKAEAESVREVLQLIEILDTSFFESQHVNLLQLQYITPDKFIERLKSILPVIGVVIAEKPNDVGVKLVPVPEIMSLLMVSSNTKWLESIQKWADKIDTLAVLGPEPRIYIYRPKHRKADVLAEVITGLRKKGGGEKSQVHTNNDITAKGSNSVKPKTGAGVLRNDDLTITIDTERNALVIFATPAVYEEVKKNLDLLDVLSRQVQIEITIAEVTLTDKLQYGVEWYLSHGGDESQAKSILSTLGGFALGDGGVSATLARTSGGFIGMLNAFAKDGLINILANPRLVVLDNESATFSVGTDVPVVTSEASVDDIELPGSGGSILRNIQYRKTGVSVTVKPTIYSNGILRLEIDQSISDAQKNDVSPKTDSPLILDRSLNTTVILESGQYILIGGLISETKSSGSQKIPLLGDLPLLGNFFKTTSNQTTRTELMMQVRPTILHSTVDARNETLMFEGIVDELRQLNDFFETSQ